mgnify:CR=1 FL=1
MNNKSAASTDKKGFFGRLKRGLTKTRDILTTDIDDLFTGSRKLDDDLLEELEELLITSDIGVSTAMDLMEAVTKRAAKIQDADGIKQVICQGLDSARITPSDVDFISAHATGTKMGDVMEAQAIGKVYGLKPMVTGLKGYMGHTMGSCGAIETILTIIMMQEGFVAPTLNLETIDRRCDMVRHITQVREAPINIAAIENFAFGGVNTNLLIKRFE